MLAPLRRMPSCSTARIAGNKSAACIGLSLPRRGQRVDFGQVQRFVGVDIAHPGQEGLVQQERFDLALFLLQAFVKQLRALKSGIERFRAQPAEYLSLDRSPARPAQICAGR